jgi:rod shape-determining protein MreD
MADRTGTALWGWRIGLVVLAAAIVFVRLLPSDGAAAGAAAPDLILCLFCAVVLRRPEFAPALLIAVLVLVEDMLTMRPPGLWAALVLGATEFLRARAGLSRELGLVGEWLLVGGVILATFAANRAVLGLAMVPQPGFGDVVLQAGFTVLAYPAVVAFLRLAGLRKPATGETDTMGRPL